MRLPGFALKLLVAAYVLSLPLAAHADTFSWSVIAAGVTGSGTYTTIPSATVTNGEDIIAVTGFVNGFAVSLVPGNYDPVNPSHLSFSDGVYFNYDNLAYSVGPTFDYHGLLMELSNGIYINLFNQGKSSQVSLLDGDPVFDAANLNAVEATINADPVTPPSVPEPSTLLMMSTGLLGLATTLRRKRNTL